MSTVNPEEIWQVEVGGQVYEAPFAELGDWIGEGSLQPDDKVRRGNLRWIEARRVPGLVPFFNAKAEGAPLPVLVNTTAVEMPAAEVHHIVATENFQLAEAAQPIASEPIEHSIAVPAEPDRTVHDPNFCAIHTDLPTV